RGQKRTIGYKRAWRDDRKGGMSVLCIAAVPDGGIARPISSMRCGRLAASRLLQRMRVLDRQEGLRGCRLVGNRLARMRSRIHLGQHELDRMRPAGYFNLRDHYALIRPNQLIFGESAKQKYTRKDNSVERHREQDGVTFASSFAGKRLHGNLVRQQASADSLSHRFNASKAVAKDKFVRNRANCSNGALLMLLVVQPGPSRRGSTSPDCVLNVFLHKAPDPRQRSVFRAFARVRDRLPHRRLL